MAKKLDITKHTKEDLVKLAHEKREELRALRFSVAGSKTRDVKAAAKLRKDIARVLTQLKKHEFTSEK
jgi:ribosomal protein L29